MTKNQSKKFILGCVWGRKQRVKLSWTPEVEQKLQVLYGMSPSDIRQTVREEAVRMLKQTPGKSKPIDLIDPNGVVETIFP